MMETTVLGCFPLLEEKLELFDSLRSLLFFTFAANLQAKATGNHHFPFLYPQYTFLDAVLHNEPSHLDFAQLTHTMDTINGLRFDGK